MDCMSDSTEFQEINSICRQPAVVLSPCGMLSHDQSLRPDTWNLVGTSGNVFGNPLCGHLIKEFFTREPSTTRYRETCCKK